MKNKKKKLSGKRGKNPKRNEEDKNTSALLFFPRVKKKNETRNEPSTDSSSGVSFLPSLTSSEEETGQRRGPRRSLFERLYGGYQDEDSSDTNGEGSNLKRLKKRRWANRSVLQVREAIKQKIAEDQFKNSKGTKIGTKVKRQMVTTEATQQKEFNSGQLKSSLIFPMLPSLNSTVSNLFGGISEDESNDNHETFKIKSKQLSEVRTVNLIC